jgi:hypothetical protein
MQQFNSRISTTLRLTVLVLTATVWGCGDSAVPPVQPIVPTAPPPTMTATSGAMGTAGKGSGTSGAKSPGTNARDRDSDRDAGSSSGGSSGSTLGLDGDDCGDDGDCASGHCNNELCCAGGECCIKTRDCDAKDGIANVCDYANTCQGSRGEVACENFRCATKDGTPNDTGCDQDVEADDCGPYLSVYCDGARDQDPPRCLEACDSDDDCDNDAYCENSVCVRDAPAPAAGGGPDQPPAGPIPCMLNSDCATGVRCLNGICEGSDKPPPAAPGAGGMASATCLESVGDDACSQCACEKCETTATACWNSGDAQRDGLCSAVMECALGGGSCINAMDCQGGGMSMPGGMPGGGGGGAAASYGCFGRACYCGTGGDCYTAPSGTCVDEIQAAAGNTTTATTISMRFNDPMFAIYDAEQHARCLQRSCRTECGL